MANIGEVKQVIGPVVDVSFSAEGSKLPEILSALEITRANGDIIVLEVQKHLGVDERAAVGAEALKDADQSPEGRQRRYCEGVGVGLLR